MSQEFEICVIMSTYNGEKYIREQIESILAQKAVSVHIVVRDDGSTDSTLKIIEEYKSDKFEIISGENIGVQRSFTKLIEYVQGYNYKYYAFADQDDVWLPQKLLKACEMLEHQDEKKPNTYFSNLTAVTSSLEKIGDVYAKESVIISKKGNLTRNFAYGCTMVFNKKAVECYARNLNAHMDMHDYWMYLICLYMGNVIYDEKSNILYRQHLDNSVGYKISFTKMIKRKIKSFGLLKTHPREEMALDLYNIFNDEITNEDKNILKSFFNYRKKVGSRVKAAFDREYLIFGGIKNLFLAIRFIIGAV